MGNRKYYMVLDTETVADARVPFDVAYTMINRDGEIVEQRNYFVQEIVDTPTGLYLLNKDRFSKDKAHFYTSAMIDNPEVIMPFDEIMADVQNALHVWNDAAVVAYNAKFDVSVLNQYSEALGLGAFFDSDVEIWDLWNIALHSLCNSRNYVEFSLLNDFITESGNVQSSAEAVFNYLLKDGSFKEAHTALADTEIEAKILHACFKRHKKLQKDFAGAMFNHPVWKTRLKLS